MSTRTFDRVAIVLGLVAVVIAAYLTVIHYEEDLLVCSVVHGCATVQASSYATVGPVPVALLGLAASVTMVGIAVWRTTSTTNRFMASAMITGMLFTALLYLGYLTYLEIFVIEAICQWCVAYLIVSAIWFALEAWALWNGMSADDLGFED